MVYLGSSDSRFVRAPASMWSHYRLDLPLVFMLMVACVFGLFILYSASGQNYQTVFKQVVFLAMGWMALFIVCGVDSRTISRMTFLIYLLGLIALLSVEFFGSSAKGAQRWLDLPGLPRFQPSELMKWIMPLTVANYLSRFSLPPHLPHVFIVFLIICTPMLLIIMQPDLGTALLMAVSALAVLFLAGWQWKHIIAFAVLGITTLPLVWKFALLDYQRSRIMVMFFPNNDPFGAGWSIAQSKVAIGSGGLFGKGWLDGTQSQLQFLAEGDTDFIMAVLAEEMGLLGVVFLLMIYIFIVLRCVRLSLRAPDNFGRLFSGALLLMFSLFIFVNVAMVSGLLPVVGVPLPLISRGGSSLLSSLLTFGLLMSVCSHKGRIAI